MGAVYLKRYIDRVQDVPHFLRRHLALIRDLDEKEQQLQHEIEYHSRKKLLEQQSGAKRQKTQETTTNYDISSAVTRLLSLADEKVTIAAQIYDFIDKHIMNLDEDLRALDAEIQTDKERLGLQDDETACGKLGIELSKPTKGRGRSSNASDGAVEKKKRGKKRQMSVEEDEAVVPLPAENEPLYCYCQKASHGAMVACENEECPHEWFHFECVGLTEAPPKDTPWYCPDCAKLMKQKKRGK
mmetsp:Transcript_24414/g.53329  ORF Transcript_24414/g.53329 Transcript_24414/m.53329 type:complete len:242 (+) Transcript_24414:123-848(+)|eukprot:CAMPEP_0202891790 /NCGR_PEP_ID=MMETSP1392-20130828/1758_1 /ASSEMBLY_ACC=CAM_ASM_000868 /TAXON_ID=225041 /ORGANISM="Chlamydomonas chlamydogama, Strain SAG 11-48b" /LENGTH=241 /DNA_ID=CAMNT_0049575643 /DNA_START=122 /DNA_END=847 /DNA_ORIENTATION=+